MGQKQELATKSKNKRRKDFDLRDFCVTLHFEKLGTMTNYIRHIISALFCVLSLTSSKAQDSLSVSVLTCTPGADLYAKFGHTALRVQNHTTQNDVVFNYGCFDGSSNDFMWKFLLGQTDYLLEAEPYESFVARYGRMGNGVTEQTLNLSQEESLQLAYLLLENIRPENQQYRYMWLYDNCTERARNMVEHAVNGKIVYQRALEKKTIRQMLNQCLAQDAWTEFGIDMILGSEIDQEVDKRIQMFLPAFYSSEVNEAQIERTDGNKAPFLSSTHQILAETNENQPTPFLLSPLFVFAILLTASILLFIFEWRKGFYTPWLDVPMHIAQGIAGIIVAFLFFLSEHPAVDSNWLVAIFNPLPLFYAGWLIRCQKKQKRNKLSYINMAVLILFTVTMAFCPQSFNTAMWLVVLSLLVRALSQAHFTYHAQP